MRISNTSGNRHVLSSASGTKKENSKPVLGLKKSELLSDLFNNSTPKNEANGSVRLRISHTSKALYKKLKVQIKEFLSQNKEISKAIDEIPIDVEEGRAVSEADLTVRRFTAYHQWLGIQDQENSPPTEDEESAPFNRVQKENKDKAIRSIFQKHTEQQKAAVSGRLRASPNYYYIIHPETYSFN